MSAHHQQPATGGLAIVGGGNMGEAFLACVLDGDEHGPRFTRDEITIVEPDTDRGQRLRDAYGVDVLELADAVGKARTVAVVVKPYLVEDVLAQLSGVLTDEHLIVSLVGGVGTARIEAAAAAERPAVVRCSPNIAIAVRQGMTAISGGTYARAEHLDLVESLFAAGGRVVRVPEPHLDIVTVVSGSVPAWYCFMVEALTDAGVYLGLTSELSETIGKQALLGAAAMLDEPGAQPARLRAAVSSPGGVTIAGIRVLEDRGVRGALMAAAEAGYERARRL